MLAYDTTKVKDIYWRLFSKKHRKPGEDYYFWTVIIQIFLMLYTFMFFQNMERTAKSILDSFSNNLFSGKMTVLLFFQIGFIVAERALFLLNPRKWRDWEMFRFNNQSECTDQDGELANKLILDLAKGLEHLPPIEKLRSVVRRLIILRRIMGGISGTELREKMAQANEQNKKSDVSEMVMEYIHNPLLKKFKFLKVIMFTMYAIIFIYIPLTGNTKVSGAVFCNSVYRPKTGFANKTCNYPGENIYIWLFFVIYTIYFVVSAAQIRQGESFMKNQRKRERRWSPLKKYINLAITKTPFIYEIKTAMDFSVTNTAIGLFDWFKFEDVYNQFFNAKYS